MVSRQYHVIGDVNALARLTEGLKSTVARLQPGGYVTYFLAQVNHSSDAHAIVDQIRLSGCKVIRTRLQRFNSPFTAPYEAWSYGDDFFVDTLKRLLNQRQ